MKRMYFIYDEANHAVKIGTTRGLAVHRLKALQTGNPTELKLLAVLPNVGPTDESFVHKRFAHLRLVGEWFRLDSELRELIVKVRERTAK